MERAEMCDHARLRRRVIIGGDEQRRTGAHLLGLAHAANCVGGVSRSGAGEHRNTACRPFDYDFDHASVSVLLVDAAPAITGMRPAACSTTISITRSCSEGLSVGLSPVVPVGTSPWLPSATCQSTSVRRHSSSSLPF